MQDIHTGFQDVNRVTDTDEFFESRMRPMPLSRWQNVRAMDAGLVPARTGATNPGRSGAALAIAPSSSLRWSGRRALSWGSTRARHSLPEARRRAAKTAVPVTYRVGDARHLDFETQSFDVCRTERVLMYVDRSRAGARRDVRVLRPSGMFGGSLNSTTRGSWWTLLIERSPDASSAWCPSSVPSPWIGRQPPRLLRERGVEAMTVIPHMILTPFAMFSRVVSGTLAQAVQTGAIASGELKTWWRSLERAEIEGGFFWVFPASFCVDAHLDDTRPATVDQVAAEAVQFGMPMRHRLVVVASVRLRGGPPRPVRAFLINCPPSASGAGLATDIRRYSRRRESIDPAAAQPR